MNAQVEWELNCEATEADFDAAYGSRYLSAGDIIAQGGRKRVRIAKVEVADLRQDGGNATRRKFVLYFIGLDKGMALNLTNAGILKDALGKNPTKWVGADVGLYVEQVQFGNKRVPGLRLKVLSKPAAPVAATPAPKTPAPAQVAPGLNDNPPDWIPDENWARDADFVG
jgi:hypothetical protein